MNVDCRYFLNPSRPRKAIYKTLHYRLPGWIAYHHYIKIDILTSGIINLPVILASVTPQYTRHAAISPVRYEVAELVAPPHFATEGLWLSIVALSCRMPCSTPIPYYGKDPG